MLLRLSHTSVLGGRDGDVPFGSLPPSCVAVRGRGVSMGRGQQCETGCWTAWRGYLSFSVTKRPQQSWENCFIHKSERVPKFKIALVGLTLLSLLEGKNEL